MSPASGPELRPRAGAVGLSSSDASHGGCATLGLRGQGPSSCLSVLEQSTHDRQKKRVTPVIALAEETVYRNCENKGQSWAVGTGCGSRWSSLGRPLVSGYGRLKLGTSRMRNPDGLEMRTGGQIEGAGRHLSHALGLVSVGPLEWLGLGSWALGKLSVSTGTMTPDEHP